MNQIIPPLQNGAQTLFFQVAGEWCFLRTPGTYVTAGNPISCVIFCHGNSGYVRDGDYRVSAKDILDDEGKSIFIRTLIDAGIAVAGSHAKGSAWGTPDAVFCYAALFHALLDEVNLDRKRMGMLGGGLGAAALWGAAVGPLLGKVQAVALQQAALNFESVIRERKFKADLLKAWGLPGDADDDLAVSTLVHSDPLQRTRKLIVEKGVSTRDLLPDVGFFHGDQDENLLYNAHPVEMAKVLDSCGAKYLLKTYKGIGHATYEHGQSVADDIRSFFLGAFENSET